MVKVDDGGFRCLMQDKRLPDELVWIVLHVILLVMVFPSVDPVLVLVQMNHGRGSLVH